MTLHRVASGQRSQGDGEEQAPPNTLTSPETVKILMQTPTNPQKGLREVRHDKDNMKDDEEEGKEEDNSITHLDTLPPTLQDQGGGGRGGSVRDNKPVQTNLPEIMEIATKLTKVSIMASPDSHLLNAAPKDLHTKRKIYLIPKAVVGSSSGGSIRTPAAGGRSKGKRDPRFVPYEPYKGCVKPIQQRKKKKKKKVSRMEVEGEGDKGPVDAGEGCLGLGEDAERRNAEKVIFFFFFFFFFFFLPCV